jgi:LysR family glycine cleavage system transcriptional activator
MIEAAVAGFGIAMGDNVLCREYLSRGILMRPFPQKAETGASFYLIDIGEHERRPAVTTIRQWLLSRFEEIRADARASRG